MIDFFDLIFFSPLSDFQLPLRARASHIHTKVRSVLYFDDRFLALFNKIQPSWAWANKNREREKIGHTAPPPALHGRK